MNQITFAVANFVDIDHFLHSICCLSCGKVVWHSITLYRTFARVAKVWLGLCYARLVAKGVWRLTQLRLQRCLNAMFMTHVFMDTTSIGFVGSSHRRTAL